MRQAKAGKNIASFPHKYGIEPSYSITSFQLLQDMVVDQYIDPAIDYIQDKIIERTQTAGDKNTSSIPAMTLSGDFRGAIVNINTSLNKSSQVVANSPNADEDTKAELIKLLEELNKELSKSSPDDTDKADAVAWAAETLIEAKTSDKPNPIKVEISKEGLQKAAQNIATAMPMVLSIVQKIIAAIDKLKSK